MFRFRDTFAGFTVHLSRRVTSKDKMYHRGQWKECKEYVHK